MSNTPGILYVVATPLGNLEDITVRAARILTEVDLIAAEDTRHSRTLLQHLGVSTALTAFHEHNERAKTPELIALVQQGRSLALVSDAGTPLINDPGFRLVRAAHAAGIRVVPVPGPCAAIAALSASGLPSDRFAFEGFPPAKETARRAFFQALRGLSATLVFYESPHRVSASLKDMADVFGREREATVARELTKRFETVHTATLGDIYAWMADDPNQQRGEFVVLVHGAAVAGGAMVDPEAERILRILLDEVPVKQAASLAARITGVKKNRLYDHALALAAGGA